MLTQSENAYGNYSRPRLSSRAMGFVLATALLVACGDPTGPTVKLQLRGTVTYHGAPMRGVSVYLRDRRSNYEPGFTVGSATTDANGHYEIEGQTGRPGYDAVCDHLSLFVFDFEYTTAPSAPIRCVTDPQTVDLTASDL